MKNKAYSRFIINLSYAFIAQIISLVLSVLMSLVMPKLLGIEEYSYWQLFIFYCNYVEFLHLGLIDGVYLRYGGVKYKELDKPLIGSQFWLLVLIQLIIAIGVLVIAQLFLKDQRYFVLSFAAIFMVISNMNRFLGYVFQATNETRIYSISSILNTVAFILLLSIGLLFKKTKDFQVFIILYLLCTTLSFTYCAIKGRAIIFAKWISFKKVMSMSVSNIRIGMNLTLSNMASILLLGFGRFLVDKIWGITAFGKLSFSLSLTSFFLLFISQISMVLFPALRQLDKKQLNKYYKYMRNLLGLLLPLILITYAPMQFILIKWLPQYYESIKYLSLLLPICIFEGKMNLLCNTYLKVLRKEKILLVINVVSMLMSMILCLVGAYILSSINFIIISIVVSIGFRNIIAEIYLQKLMNTSVIFSIIGEIILVIVFMLSYWYLSNIFAFFIFFIAYLVYLILNFKKVMYIYNILKLLLI